MKEVHTRIFLTQKLENFKANGDAKGELPLEQHAYPFPHLSNFDCSPKKTMLEMSEILIDRATSQEAADLVGPLMVAFASMTPMEVWTKLFEHYQNMSSKFTNSKVSTVLSRDNRL